jgi:DNA replication protein DnaC
VTQPEQFNMLLATRLPAAVPVVAQRRRTPLTPDEHDHAGSLFVAMDQDAVNKYRQQKEQNRRSRFERRRPTQYANASYSALTAHQDPRGMVSTWWEKGPRGLLLAGPSRTGKTTGAYAIANHVHDLGKWVEVWTVATLAKALRAEAEPFIGEYARDCDLLILDDLGREKPTDWWIEQLQELLNDRLGSGRRLVVTANATNNAESAYTELVDKYGDPIVERILDDSGIVLVNGPRRRNLVTSW